jgi:hypothetical protein
MKVGSLPGLAGAYSVAANCERGEATNRKFVGGVVTLGVLALVPSVAQATTPGNGAATLTHSFSCDGQPLTFVIEGGPGNWEHRLRRRKPARHSCRRHSRSMAQCWLPSRARFRKIRSPARRRCRTVRRR